MTAADQAIRPRRAEVGAVLHVEPVGGDHQEAADGEHDEQGPDDREHAGADASGRRSRDAPRPRRH